MIINKKIDKQICLSQRILPYSEMWALELYYLIWVCIFTHIAKKKLFDHTERLDKQIQMSILKELWGSLYRKALSNSTYISYSERINCQAQHYIP